MKPFPTFSVIFTGVQILTHQKNTKNRGPQKILSPVFSHILKGQTKCHPFSCVAVFQRKKLRLQFFTSTFLNETFAFCCNQMCNILKASILDNCHSQLCDLSHICYHDDESPLRCLHRRGCCLQCRSHGIHAHFKNILGDGKEVCWRSL